MKKTLLFTLALVSVMLIGCSKSEDNIGDPEAEQALTKEQIVGVWRNGDYWVSFSEDGYMTAYLSDKCIASGDFIIDKDTVIAESSMFYYTTKFLVNELEDKSLSCTIEYVEMTLPGTYQDFQRKEKNFSFTKTDEHPYPKKNELTGRKFKYPMDVVVPDYGSKRDTLVGESVCEIKTYFYIERGIWTANQLREFGQDYYVYRPPFLYYYELHISPYNASKDIINKLRLEFDEDDIVVNRQ